MPSRHRNAFRYSSRSLTKGNFSLLLISSVGKTDATALAAEQRGFYLRTRASSYKRYPIKGLDIAVLIVSIVLIAIGFLF